jgi:tripartite-type tricarboxylate transporter receptor subunit TctC
MEIVLRLAALALSAAAAGGALAQSPATGAGRDFPSRPLRIIVPFPPGGGSDIVSRVVAQRLADSLGQPVVVENRPGASGNIGHALAARSAADGYTILLGSSNFVANPGLLKNNPYDALKDFAAVTYAAGSPNTVVVHPSFQANTFKEFLAITRANPGKFNFASPGTGTTSHLAAALLKVEGGIDMIHVPYAGAPLAALAVLGNHVPIGFIALPPVQPHIKTGALRALAITSPQRFSAAPELPTIAESGFPGFEADTPQMFLVPAGTPQAVITRLNAEIVRILGLPEVKERLVGLGFDTVASSPEETTRRIQSDVAKWKNVIKLAGIQAE